VETAGGGFVDGDLATASHAFTGGEPLHERTGEHVEQLDLGVAADEAAQRSRADGDLHRQCHHFASR
jgi:hypothetical protein